MERRQFLKSLTQSSAILGSGAALSILGTQCGLSSTPLKNVIVIIGDDHAAGVLGCYGNPLIQTPNLDRMAKKGIRFTHAYAQAPVCSASRQSLLTGKYPHATGVTLLTTSFPDESNVTIPEHLKQFGFKTAVIGKTHFNNGGSHGFDVNINRHHHREYLNNHPPKQIPDGKKVRPKWRPFRDPAPIWLNADMLPSPEYDADTETTFLTEQAVQFIQKNKENRFCMFVGYHEPHSPFYFPIEWEGKYKPEDVSLPKGSPDDDRWVPEIFRNLSEQDRRGIIASYYTSVDYLDSKVGQILDAVRHNKLEENTLVIYIGDQGYLLNDHKRFEKHSMWEESVRAPLILQAGGRWGKDRVVGGLTEFVDLAPTICAVLGVSAMDEAQGQSLMPMLEGRTPANKDSVFSEFLCDNKAMVRTKRWKYIFTSGKRDLGQGYATGEGPSGILHKLYDLMSDPNETKNVAGDLANSSILQMMQERMLKLFRRTDARAQDIPSDISIEKQLTLFCEPPDVGADLYAK
ncbi:sulfatase-like hydrolase/transferase [candidate division KSB1 bacterium]|nr:sulfatase-like hydrolase/transferase [candidate division KSB1 bacterium]